MKQVLQLGRSRFSIHCVYADLEPALMHVFDAAKASEEPTAPDFLVEAAFLPDACIDIANYAYAQHQGCLWIDAAVAIGPQGNKVLIAGSSEAGKTTLSLALQTRGWTIAADDVLLLDPLTEELLTFAAPFRLRPGAEKLVSECRGSGFQVIESLVAKNVKLPPSLPCQFPRAIILLDKPALKPIEIEDIQVATFIRLLLARSNLLHMLDAVACLQRALSGAQCVTVRNGTLLERISVVEART